MLRGFSTGQGDCGLVITNSRVGNSGCKKSRQGIHIIVNGDYKPIFRNTNTGRDETLPYERLSDDSKKMLSKNNEAKMVLNNALPKKEALPPNWHPKVLAIEESKDLSTLLLDELIGNLKVNEVVSSDEDASSSDIEDEEYAMAVRDLKKFFRRRGKFVQQPHDDKKDLRTVKEDKRGKVDRKCFKCGDPNHFISDCPKHSYNDQKAFVGGSWSDSDEDEDLKKEYIRLMAHVSNEVHSETLYYRCSPLDDGTLQNEYNKLCKISLRIINKTKHLKTKIEILDNEVFELKEKIKRLEKNKAISEEYKSCINLHLENDSLASKLAKFENTSHFLQEMLEIQRLHNDKKGLGFTEHKASTSRVKTKN
ncbi:zf-CCHC domain-containing protein [Tanacetum coccineum]